MNVHATISPMHTVIALLRDDRPIEAIKEFRAAYGTGLKEAKDAIETIREVFMRSAVEPTDYVVISRHEDDGDYEVIRVSSRDAAMCDANSIVNSREEVMVASLLAHSVVTRSMKEVA